VWLQYLALRGFAPVAEERRQGTADLVDSLPMMRLGRFVFGARSQFLSPPPRAYAYVPCYLRLAVPRLFLYPRPRPRTRNTNTQNKPQAANQHRHQLLQHDRFSRHVFADVGPGHAVHLACPLVAYLPGPHLRCVWLWLPSGQ
jgi:hypothetical protein